VPVPSEEIKEEEIVEEKEKAYEPSDEPLEKRNDDKPFLRPDSGSFFADLKLVNKSNIQ